VVRHASLGEIGGSRQGLSRGFSRVRHRPSVSAAWPRAGRRTAPARTARCRARPRR